MKKLTAIIMILAILAGALLLVPVSADEGATPEPTATSTARLIGDVNRDGKRNAKDVTTIMKTLVGQAVAKYIESAADFNGDGKVNAKDVVAIMKAIIAG